MRCNANWFVGYSVNGWTASHGTLLRPEAGRKTVNRLTEARRAPRARARAYATRVALARLRP